MKTIVTFEHNGVYPQVGMSHRYISNLKTIQGIVNEARRSNRATLGTEFKIEDFHSDRLLWEGRI